MHKRIKGVKPDGERYHALEPEAYAWVHATLAEPLLSDATWRIARLPMARLLSLATVGLLPTRMRDRFGVRWSRAQELELRALGALSRSVTPVMPRSLRNTGPGYLRWRREALERGDVASLPSA